MTDSSGSAEMEDVRVHVIKAGYLCKRGAIFKKYKRRFFELYTTHMKYYSDEGGKFKGTIDLTNATVELDQDDEEFYSFHITERQKKTRTYVLAAIDENRLEEWTSAIKDVLSFTKDSSETQEGRSDAKKPSDRGAQEWFTIGMIHLKAKEHEKAATSFIRSMAINPDHPGTCFQLGQLHLKGLGGVEKSTEKWFKLTSRASFGGHQRASLSLASASRYHCDGEAQERESKPQRVSTINANHEGKQNSSNSTKNAKAVHSRVV